MLSPIHLRTVAAVVRTGSFADGARQLGYTSSAVSQQISQLERMLQVTLFERDAQRIRPTPAAEFLALRAMDVLAMLGSLEEDMRSVARGTLGRLRIGSFPTASERLLPGAISHYLPRHGGVDIILDEQEPDQLVPRLQEGELDLVLAYAYDQVSHSWPRELIVTELLDEDLVLLLTRDHPCFGHEKIRITELRSATWVSTRADTPGAACLQALCRGAGFAPNVAFRSNDYDVIHQFVASGLGVALVPQLSHSRAEEIVAHQVVDISARRHVLALQRSGSANPALGGMMKALQQAALELVLTGVGLTSSLRTTSGKQQKN